MTNYTLDERIDNIALAYVSSRENVSSMTPEEFLEAFKKAHDIIGELLNYGA